MRKFNEEDLVAIYKAADLMVMADEKILPEEIATVEDAMEKAGVKSLEELETIKAKAIRITEADCHGILAFFDTEQKRFVSSMLGAISSSDGDIDDRELDLWRDLCDKCDLPYMSNRQAIDIYRTY